MLSDPFPTSRGMTLDRQTAITPARNAWVSDLLALHEGPLLRYAQRFLGDLEQARDVVQETF